MKLIFIGSGSAFTVGSDNYHSNMILETPNKKRLLIDCGSDARLALHDLNLSYEDVHSVYISHLHADHCGGLEWFAFCTKYDPKIPKPRLYIHPDLESPLWQFLSVGLNPLNDDTIKLSTYFEVFLIQDNAFKWENQTIRIFPTIHIQLPLGLMPSFGLLMELDGKNVMLTTDAQLIYEQLKPLYEHADIIFQDCEIKADKSGVHAHYEDLKALDSDIKNKMWLYHYQPLPLPDAKADGFRGFVKKGQCFDFEKKDSTQRRRATENTEEEKRKRKRG